MSPSFPPYYNAATALLLLAILLMCNPEARSTKYHLYYFMKYTLSNFISIHSRIVKLVVFVLNIPI
jgi:hypothetical protein